MITENIVAAMDLMLLMNDNTKEGYGMVKMYEMLVNFDNDVWVQCDDEDKEIFVQKYLDLKPSMPREQTMFTDYEFNYLIAEAKKNREHSAFLADVPNQKWKESHKSEIKLMDSIISKLEKMQIEGRNDI